jgi:glycolate oxidase
MNATVLNDFENIVGAQNTRLGPAQRVAYSFDGTFQQRIPEAVLLPNTTEEVSRILALANKTDTKITTRGAGTSLSGGAIPTIEGLVLDLAQMNIIHEIDTNNSVAVAQPGVITGDLHRAAEKAGLFYPPDPASLQQCTIGGNVACNAGGPRCLKYGVTKDFVLGMTVVLADGSILNLGGKLVKNVTGYQLMQLFVGSEGTLGVITEITLRLIPYPRKRKTAIAMFRSLDHASESVTAIMSAGILPVALELLDRATLDIVTQYRDLTFPKETDAILILEQDGNDENAISNDIEAMAAICRDIGALECNQAANEQERQAIWETRRVASGALGRAAPNKLGEDIAVPRSQIPEMIRRIHEIGEKHDFRIAVFGHAGDGNLHPNFLFDKRIPGELERLEIAAGEVFEAALELGGTLSGEHGIGTLKKEFLVSDLGEQTVDIMRDLKKVFDPNLILNPDKIFPENSTDGFLTRLPLLGQNASL